MLSPVALVLIGLITLFAAALAAQLYAEDREDRLARRGWHAIDDTDAIPIPSPTGGAA